MRFQNVLKQIGLNVISLDGKLIKQLRTFILRCYGCFKTTSIMTKVFCPNCGNKTLKKVGVSLNADGTQHLHINFRRPLTARGKRVIIFKRVIFKRFLKIFFILINKLKNNNFSIQCHILKVVNTVIIL